MLYSIDIVSTISAQIIFPRFYFVYVQFCLQFEQNRNRKHGNVLVWLKLCFPWEAAT